MSGFIYLEDGDHKPGIYVYDRDKDTMGEDALGRASDGLTKIDGKGSEILVKTPQGGVFKIRAGRGSDDGFVVQQVSFSRHGRMVVLPEASNVIEIVSVPRE